MVGMPVFIDQGDVLTRMEEKGIALGVDKAASADAIHDAIVQVIFNLFKMYHASLRLVLDMYLAGMYIMYIIY